MNCEQTKTFITINSLVNIKRRVQDFAHLSNFLPLEQIREEGEYLIISKAWTHFGICPLPPIRALTNRGKNILLKNSSGVYLVYQHAPIWCTRLCKYEVQKR